MLRLLFAIVAAMARLLATTLDSITELLARLFGGGGLVPAPPVKDLTAALPQIEQITQARELAKGEGKATDILIKYSPSVQIQRYAAATEDARFEIDLELLTAGQQDWLTSLSGYQLKLVSRASNRQIDAALVGMPNAIAGLDSFVEDTRPASPVLAARIKEFRAGSTTAERHHVMH